MNAQAEVVEVLDPAAQDAADEAEFQRLVEKREAEKSGTEPEPKAAEPAASEPAQEPAQQEEDEVSVILSSIPDEGKRAALAARFKAEEDLRQENARLEQANRSLNGRVSAFQRRYEEAAGIKEPVAAKAATAQETAEWVQFKDAYPDIATAIESRIPTGEAGNPPELKEIVEFVHGEKRARFLNDSFAAVEEVHPNFMETVRTKDFLDWKGTSPTYEKLASSDDVADAVALMDLYERHQSRTDRQGQPTQAQAADAARLAARRGAQVEGAQSVKGKGATPNEGVDLNDEEQLFQFFAAKSNAKIKARYS